jgi:hypothetical protein
LNADKVFSRFSAAPEAKNNRHLSFREGEGEGGGDKPDKVDRNKQIKTESHITK